MTVRDCISLTLKALAYSIDNIVPDGYHANLNCVENTNNFNRCYLGIDKKGFYIEEQKEFNGEFVDGKYVDYEISKELDMLRIPVSPVYVIKMFFERDKNFSSSAQMTALEYGEEENVLIPNYVMDYGINCVKQLHLTERDLSGCFGSYREIRDIILNIREGCNSGKEYSLLLIRLQDELKKTKINTYGITSKIGKIARMSHQEIATLAIHNQEIARIISVMAEVEDFLVYTGRVLVAEYVNFDNHKDSIYTPEITDELFQSLDVERVLNTRVKWSHFCKILGRENFKILKQQSNKYASGVWRGKLTDFGLPEIGASYKVSR